MYYVLSIMQAGSHTLYFILNTLYNYFGSAIIASGLFFLLVLISKGRWMGVGDVKLAFLMGLVLGWPNILVALFLAFALGAIVGLSLILTSRVLGKQFSGYLRARYSLKSQIPFGPFLIFGTFTALFWGSRIINWYLGLLF
jgi:prepilin signal peptidase PulO-like enzyme (type II secretory pathway)